MAPSIDDLINMVMKQTDRPQQMAEKGDVRSFPPHNPQKYESQGMMYDSQGNPIPYKGDWDIIAPAPEDRNDPDAVRKMQYWKLMREFMGS